MSWQTETFGPNLVTKSGQQSTAAALAGKKRIGVYFSAHWCPPCRGFTPVLGEFYDILAGEDSSALEIIFISSDRDAAAFNGYYGEMPWSAVPFADRTVAQQLGSRFSVRGIPTFIVLDAETGRVLDADARTTVANARGVTSKALAKW